MGMHGGGPRRTHAWGGAAAKCVVTTSGRPVRPMRGQSKNAWGMPCCHALVHAPRPLPQGPDLYRGPCSHLCHYTFDLYLERVPLHPGPCLPCVSMLPSPSLMPSLPPGPALCERAPCPPSPPQVQVHRAKMQAEKENLALEKLSALMPQMGASTHVAALKVRSGGRDWDCRRWSTQPPSG